MFVGFGLVGSVRLVKKFRVTYATSSDQSEEAGFSNQSEVGKRKSNRASIYARFLALVLALVACFPALDSSCLFSRAWQRPYVFASGQF